jgi:hypothetical protein
LSHFPSRIPRRPRWDATTTPEELELNERSSFVEWRRDLAKLQEDEDLVVTPFEKNLELWRQLWRVVERSDVLVRGKAQEKGSRCWSVSSQFWRPQFFIMFCHL